MEEKKGMSCPACGKEMRTVRVLWDEDREITGFYCEGCNIVELDPVQKRALQGSDVSTEVLC